MPRMRMAASMPFKSAGDEHVRHESGHHFERTFAGVDGASLKAALIQNHRQGIGNYTFIVNDKDFRFRLVLSHILLHT
jgi:hypothetical protein